MQAELKDLRIDRTHRRSTEPSKWAVRWIIGGIVLFVLLGMASLAYKKLNAAVPVQTVRVHTATAGSAASHGIVLNATGYIVAHHKIEVAAKVVGKVAWIGVEKGDRVKAGQVLVRLEDDEYRAQLLQDQGQLANLQAKLEELQNGSRPEEVAKARSDV